MNSAVRAAATDTVQEERLPAGHLLSYCAPMAGYSFIQMIFTLYLMKYATDVLLVAPAAMGTVFLIGRIWDAVSDPLAGHGSDRTRTRLGRRRPWLIVAGPLLLLTPAAMWAPPPALGASALVLWMGVAVLLFETAATVFYVPHLALGAELTLDHHDRTRLFAWRQVTHYAGFTLAIAGMFLLIEAVDKRSAALQLALVGGCATGLLCLTCALRLRERPEHQRHSGRGLFDSSADVFRNPHAKLLLGVFFIESLGGAALGTLGPYFMHYVVGDESLFPMLLVAHILPVPLVAMASVPLSRRLGKKRVWMLGMIASAASFSGLFWAASLPVWFLALCGVGAGVGVGLGTTVGHSLQADVIDYDEWSTGERKEGTYFAVWNFVRKGAFGFTAFLAGVALQWVGFEPNVEQSADVVLWIRVMFGLLPGAMFVMGIAMFSRFALTEERHREIQRELAERAAG